MKKTKPKKRRSDSKVMTKEASVEFYIRVAGVEEKGATDCLKILPSDAEVMGNVVALFGIQS